MLGAILARPHRLGHAPPRRLLRLLHSTPTLSVRRPQVPFEVHMPRDIAARPGGRKRLLSKREAEWYDNLRRTAEGPPSFAEKYSETYGLRRGADEAVLGNETLDRINGFRNKRETGMGGGSFGLKKERRDVGRGAAPPTVAANVTSALLSMNSEGQGVPPFKPAHPPKVVEAMPGAVSSINPVTRALALKRSQLNMQVQKWRTGMDPDTDNRHLKQMKWEEDREKDEMRRRRKAETKVQRDEWNKIKKANSLAKYKEMLARRRGEVTMGDKLREGRDRTDRTRAHRLAEERWDPETGGKYNGRDDEQPRETAKESYKRMSGKNAESARWQPTKKLSYAAMAGVRELHAQDPERWTRDALSEKFGISYEAIVRILRSNWQAKRDEGIASTEQMGKWSRAAAGANSPVPSIRAVYEIKRAEAGAEHPKGESEGKGEEK